MGIALSALFGALIHRFRGGWPDKPSWMPGHARLWAALFVFVIGWPAFGPLVASLVAVLYLGGSVFGWHNWMNCGDPATYRNNNNVLPIDWAVFKIMGPYWIPVGGSPSGLATDGFAVKSPTGSVRPESWRWRAAAIGMSLRGLLYLPMLLVIPVVLHSVVALAPALVVALFGPAYCLSRWVWSKTRSFIHYRDDSLTIAEPVVGALFGAAVMAQWLIARGF